MTTIIGTVKSVSGGELTVITQVNPEQEVTLSADHCLVKVDGVLGHFADISNGDRVEVWPNVGGKTFSRIDVSKGRETVQEAARRGFNDTGYSPIDKTESETETPVPVVVPKKVKK